MEVNNWNEKCEISYRERFRVVNNKGKSSIRYAYCCWNMLIGKVVRNYIWLALVHD